MEGSLLASSVCRSVGLRPEDGLAMGNNKTTEAKLKPGA
jgi:hypothetical protein